MDYRVPLLVLCAPCTVGLPYFVYDVHRRFDEPGPAGFWLAVAGMVACVVILEAGLRSLRAMWAEELSGRPPGKPVPRPDPVVVLSWALLVEVQLCGLMTYLTTMDGGVRFAATRWVYLVYALPALALAAARWRKWTWGEQIFLRWGWAPVLAFGVPLALPPLLAAGLIRGPLD